MSHRIIIASLAILLIIWIAFALTPTPTPAAQFDSLPIADQIEWALAHEVEE